MADKFLIEGAAKLGQASIGPDIVGAVKAGFEAGFKPFVEYEKSRKQRVEALGRILQKTPNLAELPKIPAQYSPKISEWAVNAKNEYAAAARVLVQTSADTPEYQEAVQKINQITNSFVNLDDQLKGIREERIEYLDDYRNGNVSKGFKNSDIESAYGENGAITEIDANGNVSMSGSEGRSFKWNERQEHYNVNPFIQAAMVGLSGDAKANGLKGISFTQDEYKEQLKAILSNPKNGNLQALKSLVYDDIDGTSLNLQNYTDLVELLESDAPDIPLIKQKIVDYLAPALANVNSGSLAKYNEALEKSKGKEQSSYDQALSLYNQLKQNPIGYFEAYTGVAPVWDRKTNIVEIYEGGELQFKYDLNNPAQRGGFYKQLLDASDYLKGTSAKEEETRRIFDMLVMSGARRPSLTTPDPNTGLDGGKKSTAPPTIGERADQAFNAEGFSVEPLSIPANLTRNEKFFINELSKTKADITEQDIAEAVYNSSGRQIITIFGKEYKPKALYEKNVKLQSKDQENFKNLFDASSERVPIATRNKYKNNKYLNELNITDISQLTYKDIEKIKLLEKNISLGDIKIAEQQEKFKSKKIT